MRILILGSQQPWAIENHYLKYLSTLAPETRILDSADRLESFLKRSYWNKIAFRSGLSPVLRVLNEQLLTEIKEFNPDIVWVFKGVEILPRTLETLKSWNIRIANYNPDHPFIRSFRSSGGKNIERSVPLYDLHFCYSLELAKHINSRFHIPAAWLPFGYELDEKTYNELQGVQEIVRACFVGNPDRRRAAFLQQLSQAGIPLDVFGHHWKRFLPASTAIRIYDAVYEQAFWRVLRQYRVQLNLFRPHNAGSHNMRTFEVPAAGGVMLAPDTPEHNMFFENGREVFLYKDLSTCISALNNLLEKDSDEICLIRNAARQRSVKDDYTYKKRAQEVFNELNNAFEYG